MLTLWRRVPAPVRKVVSLTLKGALTVGAFYLLLGHRVDDGLGGRVAIGTALVQQLGTVDPLRMLPWLVVAALIKFIGITASMLRWHLLLVGQGIRFNFWHIAGSFLIGRFLGTFLPSTVGLDSYKLYDAARFSGRVVEPATATVVEKVLGLSGILLTFLVTLPLGYPVLYDVMGAAAPSVIALAIGLSVAVIGGLWLLLLKPAWAELLLRALPRFGRARLQGVVARMAQAATAYRGKAGLLIAVTALSFAVHFATAALYYFTARAVGVVDAQFSLVAFASSIQIFATVLSPFTIGGEGIREAMQALLLTKHMGAGQAVLSAALGFWAAEALTLVGAVFWWARRRDYAPALVSVADAA